MIIILTGCLCVPDPAAAFRAQWYPDQSERHHLLGQYFHGRHVVGQNWQQYDSIPFAWFPGQQHTELESGALGTDIAVVAAAVATAGGGQVSVLFQTTVLPDC